MDCYRADFCSYLLDVAMFVLDLHKTYSLSTYAYCMVCYCMIAVLNVRSIGCIFAFIYTHVDDLECP